MIKVLLVDDQLLVRQGLKRLLNQEDSLEVVAECEDGDEVVDAVKRTEPDVVLMDVRMKRVDGISATRALRALQNPPAISMLTTFGDNDVLWDALAAGAAGFILKDASPDDLIRATHTIAGGGAWLDPAVTDQVLLHYRKAKTRKNQQPAILDALTAREQEVLRLVAEGLLNQEIAEQLHVSEATVKTHISHIFSKLGARDRAAAIVYAYDHGLVTPRF
jgi:DNA-binding NarL/FixJ family response regulator